MINNGAENLLTEIVQIAFVIIISSLTFIFIFWKRLKEDYVPNQIFTTAFYVIAGSAVGLFIARYLAFSWWLWLLFAGSLLGLFMGLYRYKMRFYEVFEAVYIGILPALSFFYLSEAISPSPVSFTHTGGGYSLAAFLAFVVVVILLGLFYYLDTHYKNFNWYRSGRVGFSGITTLALFFLIRSAIASFFPDVVSFVGKIEALLSGLAALILFSLIYKLSR